LSIEVKTVPQNPPKRVAGPPVTAGPRVVGPSPDRAWLREFHAQHKNLWGVFVALSYRAQRISKTDDQYDSHSELLRLIAEVEQLLPAHFVSEEAGGYLSDALAIAPRLSKRAAVLQRDHRKFTARFAKLATFARELREVDESWEYLGVAIREFIRELRLHELEENRLVQEAFLDDLGGG